MRNRRRRRKKKGLDTETYLKENVCDRRVEQKHSVGDRFNRNATSDLAMWTFLDAEWLHQSNKEEPDHRPAASSQKPPMCHFS